jgi:signal transduction histidine kinase
VEWFGSASDITALKRAEESLCIAEKLAATGRLAATMAHEINSPLSALTNLLFLAKNDLGLSESTRRLLTQAEGELVWLAFIVSNTLGLQRSGDTIRIRVRNMTNRSQEPRPGVRISISDCGRGIATEHRRSIFRPSFTTKAGVGTGLGLWLTREVIEKHRGTIRFRSCTRRDKSGTVFSVFLPHRSGSLDSSSGSEAVFDSLTEYP